MQQNNDVVLSPLAAELSAMLRLEEGRIELDPEPFDEWSQSIARRSDFDPSELATEVLALGLKIRRLTGDAGQAAVERLDGIVRALFDRVDPEQVAEIETPGQVKRAPMYDQAPPPGTFTIASLGLNASSDPSRRRRR